MTDEDSLLEEFGFSTRPETSKSGGRGNVKNMIGKTNGLFTVVSRSENNRIGEATWLMKCQSCGGERKSRGSEIRLNKMRCYTCEGRPSNPKPYVAVKDWGKHFATLKLKMVDSINTNDTKEIKSLASRLMLAIKRLDEQKDSAQ